MKHDIVTLSMGGGGKLSSQLIEELFLPVYGNDVLNSLDDAAELTVDGARIAFTTDSFTVKPVFFPGGDIGKLSVCGTVNDLSVKGARPVAISAGFIIEEGFPMDDLKRIALSMREASDEVGVRVVTADTKVVGRGEVDGIFINTSGIGTVMKGMSVSSVGARRGDDIIISGTVADHGIAIVNAREGLGFTPEIRSDVATVFSMVERIAGFGEHVHVMRDPTRGGVATVLNEIARASRVSIKMFERAIPIRMEVRSCCDLLGFDPLYIANEGKIVIFVDPRATADVLKNVRSVPLGRDAAVIGRVVETPYSVDTPPVYLETAIGTKRFVPLIDGEPLPRIC